MSPGHAKVRNGDRARSGSNAWDLFDRGGREHVGSGRPPVDGRRPRDHPTSGAGVRRVEPTLSDTQRCCTVRVRIQRWRLNRRGSSVRLTAGHRVARILTVLLRYSRRPMRGGPGANALVHIVGAGGQPGGDEGRIAPAATLGTPILRVAGVRARTAARSATRSKRRTWRPPTGWRHVVEEVEAAGFEAHVAEPADTQAARGRKRRAKTDRSDARLLREWLQHGELPSHGSRRRWCWSGVNGCACTSRWSINVWCGCSGSTPVVPARRRRAGVGDPLSPDVGHAGQQRHRADRSSPDHAYYTR